MGGADRVRLQSIGAILLISAAACALQAPTFAQTSKKTHRIGLLLQMSPAAGGTWRNLSVYKAFFSGMSELGYIEGRDYVIEARSAEGRDERLPFAAVELV